MNKWINLGENESGEQEVCKERSTRGSVNSMKGIADNENPPKEPRIRVHSIPPPTLTARWRLRYFPSPLGCWRASRLPSSSPLPHLALSSSLAKNGYGNAGCLFEQVPILDTVLWLPSYKLLKTSLFPAYLIKPTGKWKNNIERRSRRDPF